MNLNVPPWSSEQGIHSVILGALRSRTTCWCLLTCINLPTSSEIAEGSLLQATQSFEGSFRRITLLALTYSMR